VSVGDFASLTRASRSIEPGVILMKIRFSEGVLMCGAVAVEVNRRLYLRIVLDSDEALFHCSLSANIK